MSGRLTVLFMSFLLALCSFSVGMLPLSFVFSKSHLAKLSAFGAGLLLGTALGVIVPEGVETLIASSSDSKKTPTTTIALSLLSGFTFMLVVEQFTSSHSHSEDLALPLHAKDNTSAVSDVPFDDDIVLDELEQDQGPSSPSSSNTATRRVIQAEPNWLVSSNGGVGNAFSLTLGLVIHGVADGLALGMSALADSKSLDISLIVFLALLIHKGPTALALTTSLLSTSLPRSACRKHVAIFAASTPVGAVLSYELVSFFGGEGKSSWPGIALLVSGGTFMYVATVLQPVLHSHKPGSGEAGSRSMARTVCVVLGMVGPFVLEGVLVGFGHEHGQLESRLQQSRIIAPLIG